MNFQSVNPKEASRFSFQTAAPTTFHLCCLFCRSPRFFGPSLFHYTTQRDHVSHQPPINKLNTNQNTTSKFMNLCRKEHLLASTRFNYLSDGGRIVKFRDFSKRTWCKFFPIWKFHHLKNRLWFGNFLWTILRFSVPVVANLSDELKFGTLNVGLNESSACSHAYTIAAFHFG